jgi:archaellum biogenesis ATPase FlaH
MSNKDLYLEDGSTIAWFSGTYENYFNKTSIIYGRRESGKSTIVLDIMYILKDKISITFVVSQSNAADFIGKVPKNCIQSSITKEWLEGFLITQKGRADLYNRANDMKTLKFLFDKVKTSQAESKEKIILTKADGHIYNIESNPKLEFSTKKEKIKSIQEIQVKELVDLYKSTIRSNKPMLDNMGYNKDTEVRLLINIHKGRGAYEMFVMGLAVATSVWVEPEELKSMESVSYKISKTLSKSKWWWENEATS